MKPGENKSKELNKMSKEEILAYVASQIKGKSLFPKQVAEARKVLSRARFVNSNIVPK